MEISRNINPQSVTGKQADPDFINSQIAFSLKLFRNVINQSKTGQNIIISPYSVVQALGMIANGADGATKAQIRQTIGNMPIENLNQYFYTYRNSQPSNKKCRLMTANSIWIRDSEELIQVKNDFLQTNADYYNASVFTAPFNDNTVMEINKWVNEHTDTMIPKLLDEIQEEAVVYIINAVAFQAKWMQVYEADDVRNRKFKNADGANQTVKMMHATEYNYLQDEYATGFLKYYQGGSYAFLALLPDKEISVTEYVNMLTVSSFQNLFYTKQRSYVKTAMPKFSYDYETELSDILSVMGMPDAFCKYNADFSGIAKLKTGYFNISRMLHKTHIDVFEAGTKATAVTGAIACAGAVLKTETVILDRPFVYGILDTKTYLPIFLGVLNSVN